MPSNSVCKYVNLGESNLDIFHRGQFLHFLFYDYYEFSLKVYLLSVVYN